MESRVLIHPRTCEAWIKMTLNEQGKERVEILAYPLIKQLNEQGLHVPFDCQTKEMQESGKDYLTFDDLEKNPTYFTYVFKETLYKNTLLKERFYWRSAHDYIDAASEKKRTEDRRARVMIVLKELCNEAESRGTTLVQEIIDKAEKRFMS
ncbi:MAG: hypothetical protein QRY71_00930 [Candidatus Rhabdochlamydia sp.]